LICIRIQITYTRRTCCPQVDFAVAAADLVAANAVSARLSDQAAFTQSMAAQSFNVTVTAPPAVYKDGAIVVPGGSSAAPPATPARQLSAAWAATAASSALVLLQRRRG
jgi:hypothetical protein